jgi:Outer membrane protein beta-barrel family/CarboxypepD_reg-like domain
MQINLAKITRLMKQRFYLFFFFMFMALASQAQVKISGFVGDPQEKPLTGATVLLLQARDSVLAGFALIDQKGNFEVSTPKNGQYIIQVSFLGFATLNTPVNADGNQRAIDLGVILMKEQTALLKEFVVEGERAPMSIKKDTVEFNAKAFGVAPNANVEDLLKKLPGVEVEKDGTVKAQGENVTRVLVNGKEFFGRDPKTATKNLPADAIDKVQVFEKMSDQAEFSGVDDGQREKTINLTLKPDRMAGNFGNFRVGGGGPEQFDIGGNMNRFSKKSQISFIGSANNINRQGFSINEYMDFTGGAGMGGGGMFRIGGGGDQDIPLDFGRNYGFTTFYSGGMNFSKDFSKRTKINGSYLYSGFDKVTDRVSESLNFVGENSFEQFDTSGRDERSGTHRLNFTFDHELDSAQSIRIIGRYSLSDNGNDSESASRSSDLEKSPRNSSQQLSGSDGTGLSLNTNVLYRRRLNRRGRNFSANLNLVNGHNITDGFNQSTNLFFVSPGTPPISRIQNQETQSDVDRLTYGIRLSYTEPIAKRGRYLEFNYAYNNRGNDNNREVYDLTPTGQIVLNNQQSNHILSDFSFHNGGLTFRLANPKLNFSTGLNLQQANLEGDLLASEQKIEQSFTNLLPNLRMRYSFSQMRSVSFDYNTNINEPSVQQLNPTKDVSNPLNTYVGNPNLRPEYQHQFSTRYNNFNQFNFTNLFAFVNFTYTQNRIQTAQTINDQLITERTPINVDNDYRLISRFVYGGRLKGLKTRYNFSAGYNFLRGYTFINGVENATNTTTPNVGVSIENQKKEKWDWSVGYRINFNNSTFSIDKDRNQEYKTFTYTASLRKMLFKDKVNLETDLDYNQFRGLGEGFDQDIPIWNAAASVFFMKGNKGQLKMSIFDILNKNQGISRTINPNARVDERINSLARYFMVSFIYSMKGFQKNNPAQGMMRMMR